MSLLAAIMTRRRPFPVLFLLCVSLLSIQSPGVVSSPLSVHIPFGDCGDDTRTMVLFHESPKNISGNPNRAHLATRLVLPPPKIKNSVTDSFDCSRIDGVMYKRPAPLRGTAATDEVVNFKMTLCLKLDRQLRGRRIGLFLFLVPYPWNCNTCEEVIEIALDNNCTEKVLSRIGSSTEAVVCAYVRYDSTNELLLSTVRIGDFFCTFQNTLERSNMPREAAVGFASITAGDPIKLRNILTWAFHSTLESEENHRLQPQEGTGSSYIEGEQTLRLDPWNRNAELSLISLRYQQNWLHNFQLTCSISVSVSYGNAV